MTSNLLRYLLSVKCKRKNSWLSRERFRRFREGCLGFKYPFLGFQSEFCQRNLLQYSGEEAQSLKTNATLEMVKPKGARMAQWWEHSSSTNVARVQIPASKPYVGWVRCWFCPLLREVFLRVLRFSPLLKNQHFQILIRPGIK